ncbi:MAG: tRNA-uridine aminocarboxypropyltransferase [Leptothrix sp. (in: b-proteobacteria)]
MTPACPRPLCSCCQRPLRACICRWISPTANAVEVLILQHPLEQHQAKGSARLLGLSLQRSRLAIGEAFEPAALQRLLGDATEPAAPVGPRYNLLLYPETVADAAGPLPLAPEPLDLAQLSTPERLRLVVLDGTWRKSRKMLFLNPLLQTLPRLPLLAPPPSQYTLLRKAHRLDQLSTLEATCLALQQLEGDAARYAPLQAAFAGFVAQMTTPADGGLPLGA